MFIIYGFPIIIKSQLKSWTKELLKKNYTNTSLINQLIKQPSTAEATAKQTADECILNLLSIVVEEEQISTNGINKFELINFVVQQNTFQSEFIIIVRLRAPSTKLPPPQQTNKQMRQQLIIEARVFALHMLTFTF